MWGDGRQRRGNKTRKEKDVRGRRGDKWWRARLLLLRDPLRMVEKLCSGTLWKTMRDEVGAGRLLLTELRLRQIHPHCVSRCLKRREYLMMKLKLIWCLLMLRLKKSTSYDCFITCSLLKEQEVRVSPTVLGFISFIVHLFFFLLLQIILADLRLCTQPVWSSACLYFFLLHILLHGHVPKSSLLYIRTVLIIRPAKVRLKYRWIDDWEANEGLVLWSCLGQNILYTFNCFTENQI